MGHLILLQNQLISPNSTELFKLKLSQTVASAPAHVSFVSRRLQWALPTLGQMRPSGNRPISLLLLARNRANFLLINLQIFKEVYTLISERWAEIGHFALTFTSSKGRKFMEGYSFLCRRIKVYTFRVFFAVLQALYLCHDVETSKENLLH